MRAELHFTPHLSTGQGMKDFKLPIMSVYELNILVKDLIGQIPSFRCVYVSGEISNFVAHRSGHFYLTLKDDKSVIKAVMFRNQNAHLKFMPENGMKVLVKARLGVFERDGVYQLYIDDMQPQGAGALSVAYEQLKSKLEQEGLFRKEIKKPLPKYPQKVGVITSPTGAAIRDIRDILTRRYPIAQIVFKGVLVQGDGAPAQLINALKELNEEQQVDVIIIGRGGGSIEDLWAFNDENLARAIAASQIPVISAVGHETDFTIADFVADLRAPTPSAAAELAVPNLDDLKRTLVSYKSRLDASVSSRLARERERLNAVRTRRCMRNLNYILDNERERLDRCFTAIQRSMGQRLKDERNRLKKICLLLDTLSPLKILSRGYAVVKKGDSLVDSVLKVNTGDEIEVSVTDGKFSCEVKEVLK